MLGSKILNVGNSRGGKVMLKNGRCIFAFGETKGNMGTKGVRRSMVKDTEGAGEVATGQ